MIVAPPSKPTQSPIFIFVDGSVSRDIGAMGRKDHYLKLKSNKVKKVVYIHIVLVSGT